MITAEFEYIKYDKKTNYGYRSIPIVYKIIDVPEHLMNLIIDNKIRLVPTIESYNEFKRVYFRTNEETYYGLTTIENFYGKRSYFSPREKPNNISERARSKIKVYIHKDGCDNNTWAKLKLLIK